MKRRCSLLVVFVGVLGLAGLAPVAQADHDATKPPGEPHEGPPVPLVPGGRTQNGCLFAGVVSFGDQNGTGGIGVGDGNHNHYRTNSVEMSCKGTNPDFAGTFAVTAAGGTDGFNRTDANVHGEHSSIGWSHSSCYQEAAGCATSSKAKVADLYAGTNLNPHTGNDQNFGEIVATDDLFRTSDGTDNWIKFCRGVYDFNSDLVPDCGPSTSAANVIAWGMLADWSHNGKDLCFSANLVLEPTGVNPNVVDVPKINQAALEGKTFLWEDEENTGCHGPRKFVK